MARNFIDLQEVARLLGVTADELSDMRSRNEIYGYRDGNTWKFKVDEVQRVANERGVEVTDEQLSGDASSSAETDGSGIDAELDELSDASDVSDADSILVSDSEGGAPRGKSPSSTVIGKDEKGAKKASDLKLKSDGLDLELAEENSGDPSKLKLAPTPTGSENMADSGSDLQSAENSDALSLDSTDSSDLISSDSLSLSGSDLRLEGDSASGKGDDAAALGSAVDLDFEADENVVGSDVMLTTGDSGISLKSPSDTGLSLVDEPLNLDGSVGDSALELPEEVVPLDVEPTSPDAATELKADDEFLLTAVEDDADEDSDSGSQVIALDSEESYDEEAATMLGSDAVAITEADSEFVDVGTAAVAGAALGPVRMAEVPYALWNVLCLGFVVATLGMTGMMMMDLVRYMWSWGQPVTLNSSIMEFLSDIFGGG